MELMAWAACWGGADEIAIQVSNGDYQKWFLIYICYLFVAIGLFHILPKPGFVRAPIWQFMFAVWVLAGSWGMVDAGVYMVGEYTGSNNLIWYFVCCFWCCLGILVHIWFRKKARHDL